MRLINFQLKRRGEKRSETKVGTNLTNISRRKFNDYGNYLPAVDAFGASFRLRFSCKEGQKENEVRNKFNDWESGSLKL